MRILFANEALAGAGGVETYLSGVMAGLQARGHSVGLLHYNSASDGGPVRVIPPGAWRAGVQDEGMASCLERVRQFAPDVCFSHNMGVLDVDAALLAEWPVVKMMHGHFGTCISGHKAFGFPDTRACTRTFGPACLVHYLPRRCGRIGAALIVNQYRWAVRQRSLFDDFAGIVVASSFMRDEYVANGADPSRVQVLPLFAPREPLAASQMRQSRTVDVAFLGRMTPLKGGDVLLRACAAAARRLGRRIYVVMAGDGPQRERLQVIAASADIDVSFPGWVNASERDALLMRSALVAIPSIWPEPFGLVGLEAAVVGTPAVAFDAGGIREWLTDRANGRLIPAAGGAPALGETIAALLRDEQAWRTVSDGARMAASRFSIQAHLDKLERVLGAASRARVPA